MVAQSVLDHEHFAAMTDDDPQVQAEILQLFREQAALWDKLLTPNAPLETWRNAAHSCKGSAKGLGLWRLAAACSEAEALGLEGEMEGRTVAAALERARAALAEALEALPHLEPAND